MQPRLHRRLANAAFVAIVAAAVVVPYSAFACSGDSTGGDCCCKHRSTATNETPCGHQMAPESNCLTKACGCCQPAVPQNVPSESATTQLSLAAIPVASTLFHGGSEFAAPTPAVASVDLVARPHRILHCSWLI